MKREMGVGGGRSQGSMSYVVARLTKSRAYWLMVTINEYGEINVE
jgi:hypothetical protein